MQDKVKTTSGSSPKGRSFFRSLFGTIGEWIIYTLIRIFGRVHREQDVQWLVGPTGSAHIGDQPYQETADAEGLTLERNVLRGGLIPCFAELVGESFDPAAVHPAIAGFYENTAQYKLDTWATTHFPASVGLWLLVTTISHRVDQLNFPLDALDTSHGMTSEIVLLRSSDKTVKYTGWYRKLRKTDRSIYTGFYTTAMVPNGSSRCVKVIFPMPNGNATVLLRPGNTEDGGFTLDSDGGGFGDAGFYRVQRAGAGKLRVWRIKSLREYFKLHVDDDGLVRCDHTIKFLGLRVLSLHYKCTLDQ